MRASSKIMKKLKSYFISNSNRAQYKHNLLMKLPIGSGVIESAIRRVVNLRLKSPGSFWNLEFAEKMIYLRSQILYGRWQYLKSNWGKALVQDFKKLDYTRKELDKLKPVIDVICEGKGLESKYRDHELIGNYGKARECHIEPDWLLIYELFQTDV